jgi:glycosyltransferase involved in cell wall biosynthesis
MREEVPAIMRILIVNKFLYPNGGSETYIFGLGRGLQALGHEVQYFGMEHEGRIVSNRVQSYTEDIEFHGAGMAQKLTYPAKIIYSKEARRKIRPVLEDFQPDAVHLNNINFQITPSVIDEIRAWNPSCRIVYTAHDAQWVCPCHMLRIPSTGEFCTRCIDGAYINCMKNRCIHNSRARSIFGTMEAEFYKKRGTYRLVDTIICPSEFMNRMLSHNPQLKGRTVTLHNFYENKGALQDNSGAEKELLDRGISKRGYVLYFGRFSREKGVHTLLQVCRDNPEIPFVFAGRGELEDEVNALSGANVINMGFCSGGRMQQLIRNAAFTVLPSEWGENCPYSVMESQMNGTPVVGTAIGGIPELIEDGTTGLLCRPFDPAALTDRIRALWYNKSLQRELQANCARSAEGRGAVHYDTLEEYCGKMLKIYRG